jgi:hypothetical protein
MFCIPGGATAIMIARVSVMEKITLPAKWKAFRDERRVSWEEITAG